MVGPLARVCSRLSRSDTSKRFYSHNCGELERTKFFPLGAISASEEGGNNRRIGFTALRSLVPKGCKMANSHNPEGTFLDFGSCSKHLAAADRESRRVVSRTAEEAKRGSNFYDMLSSSRAAWRPLHAIGGWLVEYPLAGQQIRSPSPPKQSRYDMLE